MSDWGATHSTVAAALAGLDQQMPDASFFGSALEAAVAAGTVPQSRIDDMVMRMLTPMFGALGLGCSRVALALSSPPSPPAHHPSLFLPFFPPFFLHLLPPPSSAPPPPPPPPPPPQP